VLVYKIVHLPEWREAVLAGWYAGSAKDRADGFLHFSSAKHVAGTLAKYYAGATVLILVAVETAKLGPALKFEQSRDGTLFPHLYAILPLSAVSWAKAIDSAPDGAFMLPPELEAARR
jgi:uncharacterized protein (DUF952 family)